MAPPREYPYRLQILLLLTQVTLATDNLSLEVVSYNSSVVDLACRYEGNKNNLFFNIYKQSDACIFYKGACQYYPQNDCRFKCKDSEEKWLIFSVELSGNCQERIHIRCSVRSLAAGQELELDAVHTLLAQSDSPEISIGDENPVVILEQVPIECTVANRCNQTKLEISGAHLASLNIDHTRQESRFSTTAKTTAIFDTPGNFTITCKEADKGASFSSFHTVEVHDQYPFASQDEPPRTLSVQYSLIIGVSLTALILTIGGCVILQLIVCKRRGKRFKICGFQELESGDPEELETLMNDSTRYKEIEGAILKMNSANIRQQAEKILKMLDKGKPTFPPDGNSLIYYLLEKFNDFYDEGSILLLMLKIWEDYKISELSKNEDLTEIIWEKMGEPIETESDQRKCIEKLKILLPFCAGWSTRLLWRFVKHHAAVPEKTNKLPADVLEFLIRQGANPFMQYDETSAFTQLLEKSNQTRLTSTLAEVFSRWDDLNPGESILNDIIKSVSSINHLIEIKEPLDKIIEKNAGLCNHVDNEKRTPLHNLMMKIFVDGDGWNLPEIESLGTLGELTMKLTTEKNVNMCDKDDVTPYSWILFELLSRNDLSKDVLYSQNTESISKVDECFGRKNALKEKAVKGFNVVGYRKIEKVIKEMPSSNKYHCTRVILDILEEWEIIYPTNGQSIMSQLIERTEDLYKGASFTILIKALYPSYRQSVLYEKENLTEIIWKQIKPFSFLDEKSETECIYKLKIFIHMEAGLSTRLLWRFAKFIGEQTWNSHFINVVKLLVQEGADPFEHHDGTCAYILFLEKSDVRQQELVMSLFMACLAEAVKKGGISHKTENILNDIIKSVRSITYLCDIKEHIFKMIEKNPDLCDHTDSDGRTPLHNLMIKIFLDDVGWNMQEIDSLDLIMKLITMANINMFDKERVTPYCWICVEKKTLQDFQPSTKSEGFEQLSKKMVEIEQYFEKKGASMEEAETGIKLVGERRLKGLLEKMMEFNAHMGYSLMGSEEKAREFITTLEQEVEIDCHRISNLEKDGYLEYFRSLPQTTEFLEFAKTHIEILDVQILKISKMIMKVMIVECNYQAIYEILIEHAKDLRRGRAENINYNALWHVIKQCLDKGVCPKKDDIIEVFELNILKPIFKTPEALLDMIQIIHDLLTAYRKHSKSDPVELYLNPLQDQYKVNDNLRKVASNVIELAYGDFRSSGSVINALLSLTNIGDGDIISTCFKTVDELLSKEVVLSENEEKSHGRREKNQRRELIKRNCNWLKRNMLHLAAIFCHDEKVLHCIPQDLIERILHKGDIHGSTPLHLAYLHDNKFAIRFLESLSASEEIPDYFGRTPKSNANSKTGNGVAKYEVTCSSILDTNTSVFDAMKPMLVLQVKECELMGKKFEKLFNLVFQMKDIEIKFGGSVRERLKVGRPDEVDVQICNYTKQFLMKDIQIARRNIYEVLINKAPEANKEEIPPRLITFGNPWKFIWEEEDCYHGLEIAADIELFSNEEIELTTPKRLEQLIENAPSRQCLIYLKVDDFGTALYWSKTMCRHEWDILDNLPQGCRLGICIAKALLEALEHTCGNSYKQVSPQVIKNAIFWILAGQTPKKIEKAHGNIINEKYHGSQQKLHYTERKVPTWTSEEDLKNYGREGREWAEKIFGAIHLIASKHGVLLGRFLLTESHECFSLEPWQLYEVIDTCEICLERLRPEVFF